MGDVPLSEEIEGYYCPKCEAYHSWSSAAIYHDASNDDTRKTLDLSKPTLEELGASVGRMVGTKRIAYGNSTGVTAKIMKLLLPNGVKPEQYEDVQFANRIIDKISRRLASGNGDDEDAIKDGAGYFLLWLEQARSAK